MPPWAGLGPPEVPEIAWKSVASDARGIHRGRTLEKGSPGTISEDPWLVRPGEQGEGANGPGEP